jgi:hypothetical protein
MTTEFGSVTDVMSKISLDSEQRISAAKVSSSLDELRFAKTDIMFSIQLIKRFVLNARKSALIIEHDFVSIASIRATYPR